MLPRLSSCGPGTDLSGWWVGQSLRAGEFSAAAPGCALLSKENRTYDSVVEAVGLLLPSFGSANLLNGRIGLADQERQWNPYDATGQGLQDIGEDLGHGTGKAAVHGD